jgi:hypothetical protein
MREPELGTRLLLHRTERLRGPAKEQAMGRRRRVPGVDLWLPQPQDLGACGVQRPQQVLAHRQPRAAHAGTDEDPDPMPERDQARHDGEEQRNITPALAHRHQDITPIGHVLSSLPLTDDAERRASATPGSRSEARAEAGRRRLQADYRYSVLLSVILCTPGR